MNLTPQCTPPSTNPIIIDNTQSVGFKYISRQGNLLIIPLTWYEPDGVTLRDISGYTVFAQITDNTADNIEDEIEGEIYKTYEPPENTPDADGSKYTKDDPTSTITFYLGDELTRDLETDIKYYLDIKLVDTDDQNVENIIIELQFKPEYSRNRP